MHCVMQSSRAQTVVHFVVLLMCTLLVGSSAIFYFDHICALPDVNKLLVHCCVGALGSPQRIP